MLKIVMVYRYLLWRVGAESGGALRFRKYTKKQRNVGGLSRKKNTLPRIPGEWKTSGRPKWRKGRQPFTAFRRRARRVQSTLRRKLGRGKRKWGIFVEKWSVFLFFFPTFAGGCASRSSSRPRVYALSEFSDFCLHRGNFSFQFIDFQCVVSEGFTFRCFCYITL